ncbi:MAG: glycosyltransferase family 39 protein [Chthoniobacteraceae bacterium]
MASETKAQELVHTLEHGRGRRWVYALLIIAFALFQSVAHVLINPMNRLGGQAALFVGLTHPKGMEQAVIARELARGHGFSTLEIKPAAVALVEKSRGADGFSSFLDPDGPTGGNIPDIYHAPLNPWLNSCALFTAVRISDALGLRVDAKGQNDFWTLHKAEYIHPADRIIAGVSVLCFLAAVFVSFLTVRRLFDERLAAITTVLMLFCNEFWRFSSSGLPQMLMLLLFSLALYFSTRALGAQGMGGRTWPWHAAAGLAFGLLALTHALTTFIFVGALIYTAITFSPRGRDAAIMLLVFLACLLPWLVRNERVCGSPFGIAGQTRLFALRGSESQIMRTFNKPDDTVPAHHFRGKMQTELLSQIGSLVGRLGKVIVAPLFFLALLHAFRKRETRTLRWGILLMLLFGALGMAFFGFADSDLQTDLQSNDLYPLFIPITTAYGLALVLVMWSRVQVAGRDLASIRQVNIAFHALIILICAFPLLNVYTDPPKLPFVWPPYCPPAIADLSDWYSKSDIICSDMPWATAWYADRKSLWLPLTIADFNDLNEFRFHGKITGLLVTPVTGFRGLLSDVGVGEFKDWRAFIMREPRAATSFVLKVAHPIFLMGASHYLLFADRDRWTERNN